LHEIAVAVLLVGKLLVPLVTATAGIKTDALCFNRPAQVESRLR
jgi:hypothetical protein